MQDLMYSDKKMLTEMLTFVRLVRSRAMEDNLYLAPTDKQHAKLVISLNKILVDKNNRKAVLMAITGIQIASQKQLTRHYMSVLIDEMEKNDCISNIIKEIENQVRRCQESSEGVTSCRPWLIFSRAGIPPSLSNLQGTNNDPGGYARSPDLEGNGAGSTSMENQQSQELCDYSSPVS